jgi:protein ImuB
MNPIAYEEGLREGMNIPTAASLSPGCHFITYDEIAMEDALHKLAKQGLNLASWVSIDSPFGIYMEVASMERLMGKPNQIAARLRECVPNINLIISSAPQAKAARLLAISGIERHLSVSNLKLFLAGLQLQRLHWSPKLELSFKKLGIKTLGELFKISSQDIAYRIDKEFACELNQLIGKQSFLPKPFQPKPIFFQQVELQKEAEHHQQMVFPIKRLLKAFCHFMIQRGLTSQVLMIQAIDRQNQTYPLALKLARSTQSFEQWFELAQQRLECFQPQQPILQLRIISKWFTPFEVEHGSLFKGEQQESRGLKNLINQLTSRLSQDQVSFIHAHDHHAPELQTVFNSHPYTQTPPISIHKDTPQVTGLLPKPKPINLTLYTLIQGPHRIRSLWWQQHHVIRDYYIAQHKHGALHWLFKDVSRKWYLHGYLS